MIECENVHYNKSKFTKQFVHFSEFYVYNTVIMIYNKRWQKTLKYDHQYDYIYAYGTRLIQQLIKFAVGFLRCFKLF